MIQISCQFTDGLEVSEFATYSNDLCSQFFVVT